MLTLYIKPQTEKMLRTLAAHERRSLSDMARIAIEDMGQKILDKKVAIATNYPSPSSSCRASSSSRPRAARAAKAEAPKASPAPASRYPAGLEEGVKALCREVWKKGGPFQLDGQTCELASTAVNWLLEHAAETMERRNLDVEGYLAFRRSQMLAGGEAGL